MGRTQQIIQDFFRDISHGLGQRWWTRTMSGTYNRGNALYKPFCFQYITLHSPLPRTIYFWTDWFRSIWNQECSKKYSPTKDKSVWNGRDCLGSIVNEKVLKTTLQEGTNRFGTDEIIYVLKPIPRVLLSLREVSCGGWFHPVSYGRMVASHLSTESEPGTIWFIKTL